MGAPFRLTERQARFVAEYAATGNASEAYRRAYPGGTALAARSGGRDLLRAPAVAAAVVTERRTHRRRCRVSAARTLRTLAAIAFADPADYFADAEGRPVPRPLADLTPAARTAVKRVLTRRTADGVEVVGYELHDKLAALDRLARHLGLFAGSSAAARLLAAVEAAGHPDGGRAGVSVSDRVASDRL